VEQLKSGLWLILVGVNEIPPHIAIINEGKYYSQSARKVDCGTTFEKLMNAIQRKRIPTVLINIGISTVIARKEAPHFYGMPQHCGTISTNLLLEKIYKNLQPLGNAENTCLTPIRLFFSEYCSDEFKNANYVFELLALAEKKGLLKESVSLFCGDSNSNVVTLPKYTIAQIKNKIREISSFNTTTHATH
jgi:hypothetical protein